MPPWILTKPSAKPEDPNTLGATNAHTPRLCELSRSKAWKVTSHPQPCIRTGGAQRHLAEAPPHPPQYPGTCLHDTVQLSSQFPKSFSRGIWELISKRRSRTFQERGQRDAGRAMMYEDGLLVRGGGSPRQTSKSDTHCQTLVGTSAQTEPILLPSRGPGGESTELSVLRFQNTGSLDQRSAMSVLSESMQPL